MCQQGVCVGSSQPPVDQVSLGPYNQVMGFAAASAPSQTFTVGRTGQLVGIEVEYYGACSMPPSNGSVRLDVLDAGGVVATASVPTSAAPTCTSGAVPLDPCTIGPGFFDLSASQFFVTTGDVLRFTFGTDGIDPGVCTNGVCTSGYVGAQCFLGDANCEYNFQLRLIDPGPYPGGTFIAYGGMPMTSDVIFKTFVR